jgi:hypothetical protein
VVAESVVDFRFVVATGVKKDGNVFCDAEGTDLTRRSGEISSPVLAVDVGVSK